jgi:polyisoprenyl-phosphate glycosyltransferase
LAKYGIFGAEYFLIIHMMKQIGLIIPVLNEEGNIYPIFHKIKEIISSIPQYQFSLLFINDGSTDTTIQKLKELANSHEFVSYISFSRNFGKDNALLAGFENINADAVITLDADLQHPPCMIPNLIAEWEKGYKVVYTYREQINIHNNSFSNFSSKLFYNLINKFSDVKLEQGISDFRILDKQVISELIRMKENEPFYRGLIKWVGFNQKGIPYTPASRNDGNPSYNIKGLFKLALNGITAFSTTPLNLAIYLGFFFSCLSTLYIPYAIFSKINGIAISGWTSVIVTIAFFGGLQLMILGIMGIYLGKVFMQNKQRPRYIIDEQKHN